MRFNQTALKITTLMLFASPAVAGGPLVFEWSGTDESNNPFSVAFTVTDAQNGDTTYDSIDFGDTDEFVVITETLGQTQIISNVTSTTLGGAFALPSSTNLDPYSYVFAQNVGGQTYLSTAVGAHPSDIGLTFNGNTLEYVEFDGDLPLTWVDPTTATSLSDLFPVGTYAVTDGFGFFSWNDGADTESPTPTTLTISVAPAVNVIPEPASVGLGMLGLGGLALLRRR